MEVIFMEPFTPIPPTSTNPSFQPTGAFVFAQGIFNTDAEGNDFLSSLDSDTRDYVIKHTDEFRTRNDIFDCVNRLHGNA
jgi:hypothetical protein